jgi:2-isopropylmalate synthase
VDVESEADLNAAFARFKELADRKSEIFDEDIMALVGDSARRRAGALPLRFAVPALRNRRAPQARVVLTVGGEEVVESDGNGPVDASLKAIESRSKVVPRWCCIRSTRSPRAAQNRRAR